jgi:hypothetical protein
MKFIVHDEPALRADSNYIAQIALSPFGLADEIEQVWLHRTGDGTATLCCIPFRAYGLALGDTVRISADGSTVAGVVARSGRRVLRALFVGPDLMRPVAELENHLVEAGLCCEWSGDRHVAIDVPSGVEPSAVLDHLDAVEADGKVHWEWADVEPFAV